MRRLSVLLLTLVALVASGPALALDGKLGKQDRADMLRFAEHNSLFVLYHEVAHLLIDQLQLPVLGNEEDAADNFATWVLLGEKTPHANQALRSSVKGWLLSDEAYGSGTYEEDYYDGYSLDRERAMQILCLMVGSDGAAFRDMANEYAIPRGRQDTCRWDYNLIDRSYSALLDEPGTGTRVVVRYQDGGVRLRTAERAFRASGIFEEVAEHVRGGYRISRPVRFTAQRCDEANAFYDADTVEIIFCYELMQDYMDLFAQDLAESR